MSSMAPFPPSSVSPYELRRRQQQELAAWAASDYFWEEDERSNHLQLRILAPFLRSVSSIDLLPYFFQWSNLLIYRIENEVGREGKGRGVNDSPLQPTLGFLFRLFFYFQFAWKVARKFCGPIPHFLNCQGKGYSFKLVQCWIFFRFQLL